MGPDAMKRRAIWVVLLLSLILLVGCRSAAPTETPSPFGVRVSPPPPISLDDVRERLGYVLVPDYLPEGYRFSWATMNASGATAVWNADLAADTTVLQTYLDSTSRQFLFVEYPVSFSPGGNWVERLGLRCPDAALSEVKVKDERGYLLQGNWSDATQAMWPPSPEFDPALAEWDYDLSLSLFAEIQICEDRKVGVWIEVSFRQSEWTPGDELIKVAESLRCAN